MTATEQVLVLGGLLLGIVKTGFGGGVGVVVAPVVALVVPAKQALGVVLPLTLAADAFATVYYRRHRPGSLLRPLIPGTLIGLVAGWVLLDAIPEALFRKLLGGLACLFVAVQPFGDRFRLFAGRGRVEDLAAGVLLGTASMLAHTGGVIMMMYLQARGLSGQAFVATAVLVGLVLNLIKFGPYLTVGVRPMLT